MAFGAQIGYIDSSKAQKALKAPIQELLWLFSQSGEAAKAKAKAQTNKALFIIYT